MELIPTPSQTVGPFFHFCLTAEGKCTPVVAGPEVEGEKIRQVIRVFDGNDLVVEDAMIEIWQADAQGRYNHSDDVRQKECDRNFRGFGRMGTDGNGQCEFQTIKPGPVPGPVSSQAPHINVAIFARGLLKQLYTRIYFDDDVHNAQDAVLQSVPARRRETLIAKADGDGLWRFDIHLQGTLETVFFDI